MRLVCGVGLNDLRWSNREENHSKREVAIYDMWVSMLTRCYSSREHFRAPTYIGCSVCDRWLTLSNFAHDVYQLPGYAQWKLAGYSGYALDKDIRVSGNRVYSPDTCSIVTFGQNSAERNQRVCSRRVMFDGVEYSSLREASEHTHYAYSTLGNHITNAKGIGQSWVDRSGNSHSIFYV